ncbi:neuroligin-2 [Galendromus occidentalis]|uniref:Neuroligin-2 n=1 Tax=Galendromus occidentalis TaxID=34638 RepID=A0AAJ7SF66_9ACAR|nr:neuroligin-2 [Galendromus occidentalis]
MVRKLRPSIRRSAFVLLVLTLMPVVRCTRLSSRTVTTRYGALKGSIVTLESAVRQNLQPVEVFLGVPYASPPLGNMRFMPPGTPTQWKGIRMADRFAPVCPQKPPNIQNETEALKVMPRGRYEYLRRLLPFLQKQSEDCLYLNIYSPAVVGRSPLHLPVMVFIQGESYEWNSGNSLDGTLLASLGNVVVVTLNYRLGIFGFLPPISENGRGGNNGLLDLVAALHWIQGNIAEFGGDTRNVTVIGHGQGGALANLLMLTPMAKGLFQRAVLMSGSALSPWAIAREAPKFTKRIGQALDCPIEDNKALVECLKTKPAAEIIAVEVEAPEYHSAFGPCVDGIVVAREPLVLMEEHSVAQLKTYDAIFGVTSYEAYDWMSAEEEKYGIEAERRDRILRTLVRNLFTYHQQEILLTVLNEYTDWTRPFPPHPLSILDSTAEVLGDALVVAPLFRAASLHARVAKNSFVYVFGYMTEHGDYPNRVGGAHGEDLPYLFGAPLTPLHSHFKDGNYSKSEQSLAEAYVSYWSNFARVGDPSVFPEDGGAADRNNSRDRNRLDRLPWAAFDPNHQKFMYLGMKPKLKDHYHAHRLSLWNHLIPMLHRSGGSDVSPSHHLLDGHDNPHLFDGVILGTNLQQMPSFKVGAGAPGGVSDDEDHALQENRPVRSSMAPFTKASYSKSLSLQLAHKGSAAASTPEHVAASVSNASSGVSHPPKSLDHLLLEYGGYSTALSVTVAVGCSLLVLNLLIFCGVYYQRDRVKQSKDSKSKKRKRDKNGCQSRGGVNAAASNISLGKDHQQDMMTATSILRNATSMPDSPQSQVRAESQQHTATINRHLHPQGMVKAAPPQLHFQLSTVESVDYRRGGVSTAPADSRGYESAAPDTLSLSRRPKDSYDAMPTGESCVAPYAWSPDRVVHFQLGQQNNQQNLEWEPRHTGDL